MSNRPTIRAKLLMALCCGVVSLTADPSGATSSAVRYSFVVLADNTGPLLRMDLPVISNTGVVAFGASLDDGSRGLFALTDGVLTQIGDSARFPDFNSPSISGNGTVVFCVREANSGPGTSIYAWQSDELLEVVNRTEGPFTDLNTLPGVNNGDYVVFWGRLATGDVIAGKRLGADTFEIISRGAAGPDQAPALNAAKSVAFVSSGNAIVEVGRKGWVERITEAGPFRGFSGAVSLNDSGEIAFHANMDSGVSGVFVSTAKEIKAVAVSGAQLAGPHRPTINNRGEVIFMAAAANNVVGIFAGPDPVLDKIVAVGDTIEGMTVESLDFFKGLNDRGQIVFTATQQGIQRLYRADPR